MGIAKSILTRSEGPFGPDLESRRVETPWPGSDRETGRHLAAQGAELTAQAQRDRGTPLKHSLRKILSFATYPGLVPPPPVYRPRGVSALVIAKNEEDWVEASVLPLADFVDELVVADNGSKDSTPAILERLHETRPDKIRLLNCTSDNFVVALNRLLSSCRYRWILRWNADFVARTSGPCSIGRLIEQIRSLDPLRYFSIALSGVALDGDLEHQLPARRDPPEPFAFTASRWLRYVIRDSWESLQVPWFYEKLEFPDAYYFHLRSVKSSARLLQMAYWSEWFARTNRGERISMEAFVAERGLEDFGGPSVDEAANRYAIERFRRCVPFSRDVCGDYPDPLLPYLENPPYTLVFENGRLVGRTERPRDRGVKAFR